MPTATIHAILEGGIEYNDSRLAKIQAEKGTISQLEMPSRWPWHAPSCPPSGSREERHAACTTQVLWTLFSLKSYPLSTEVDGDSAADAGCSMGPSSAQSCQKATKAGVKFSKFSLIHQNKKGSLPVLVWLVGANTRLAFSVLEAVEFLKPSYCIRMD